MFYSKSFTTFNLTFIFVITFELLFISDIPFRLRLIFWHMGVQLFHHHLLKRLFFLPWTVFTHFVKNQSDGFVWVYFCNCYGHSSVCLSHEEYYTVLINVILWYILKLGSMIFLTLLFFKIILVVLVLLSFQINFTICIFYIYKNIYFFKIHTFIYKYILLYIYKTVYTHILSLHIKIYTNIYLSIHTNILLGFSLELYPQPNLERIDIFTMLSFPVHEHMLLHLLRSRWITMCSFQYCYMWPFPKFAYWHPNLQYLVMWPYLEIRSI